LLFVNHYDKLIKLVHITETEYLMSQQHAKAGKTSPKNIFATTDGEPVRELNKVIDDITKTINKTDTSDQEWDDIKSILDDILLKASNSDVVELPSFRRVKELALTVERHYLDLVTTTDTNTYADILPWYRATHIFESFSTGDPKVVTKEQSIKVSYAA
jgi:hypothetical protein